MRRLSRPTAYTASRKRSLLLALVTLALPAMTWRAESGPAPAAPTALSQPTATVTMTNRLSFEPKSLTIAVGQTVEWRNTSLLVHTVTADPAKATREGSAVLPQGAKPFDSGNIEPDGSFEHTFSAPGTYRYFCIPHEGAAMVGEIIVTARDGS